jgi:hypothetical protein
MFSEIGFSGLFQDLSRLDETPDEMTLGLSRFRGSGRVWEMKKYPKRLYKFLSAQWGLQSLKDGEFKVSTIDTMDDPFELLPYFTVSDPSDQESCRKAQDWQECWRDAIREHGVICMSAVCHEPLLWSHYADSHTGMAFEFLPPSDHNALIKVKYSHTNNPQTPSYRLSMARTGQDIALLTASCITLRLPRIEHFPRAW